MSCNGWKNRATWNVAMHIGNDPGIYEAVREAARRIKAAGRRPIYKHVMRAIGLEAEKTSDGICWISKQLDYRSLNNMIVELIAEDR
jgi:hypothetical protein